MMDDDYGEAGELASERLLAQPSVPAEGPAPGPAVISLPVEVEMPDASIPIRNYEEEEKNRVREPLSIPMIHGDVPNFLELLTPKVPKKGKRKKRSKSVWSGWDVILTFAEPRPVMEPPVNEEDETEFWLRPPEVDDSAARAVDVIRPADSARTNPYVALLSSGVQVIGDTAGHAQPAAAVVPPVPTSAAQAVGEVLSTQREPIASVPEYVYHPIEQTAWEDAILWSDEDAGASSEGLSESAAKKLKQSGTRAATTETRFRLISDELDEGSWIDSIIWDDAVPPQRPPPTQLILDVNDRDAVLDPVRLLEVEAQLQRGIPAPAPVSILSRFNISMDEFYASAGRTKQRQKLGKTVLLHSQVAIKNALSKPLLTDEEILRFHRARLRLPLERMEVQVPIDLPLQSTARVDMMNVMQRPEQLTANTGHVILLEYMEEHPPLVMIPGMATRIRHYYRKTGPGDAGPKDTDLDGELVELEPGEQPPFLGDIQSGVMVGAVYNNLYTAPMAPHVPRDTDFLVIHPTRQKKILEIRRIPRLYAVGQEHPRVAVPDPGVASRVRDTQAMTARELVRARMANMMVRLSALCKREKRPIIMHDVKKMFPDQNEKLIRMRLKGVAELYGDEWLLRSSSHIPEFTPEMQCMYESMEVGSRRLIDIGMSQLSDFAGLDDIVKDLSEHADDDMRDALGFVEEELRLTPWALTGNFMEATKGGKLLTLSGIGDPSGCGDAYSFQLVPTRGSGLKRDKPPKDAPKAVVMGTNADLRKVTHDQTTEILLGMGVPLETFKDLTRWKRINIIRTQATQAGSGSVDGFGKFARGYRAPLQHLQKNHREKSQQIFKRMLNWISNDEAGDSDSDEDEQVEINLESFGRALENRLAVASGMTKNAEEQAEGAALKKLLHDETPEEAALRRLQAMMKPSWEQDEYDEADEVASTRGPPPLPVIDGRRKVLKRSVMIELPDGTLDERVDVIRDPAVIRAYLENREKLGLDLPPPSAAAERDEAEIKKPKKTAPSKLKESNKNISCGACGGKGHMKTNQACPMYNETMAALRATKPPSEDEGMGVLTPGESAITLATDKGLVLKINPKMLKPQAVVPESGRRTRGRGSAGIVALSRIFREILETVLKREAMRSAVFMRPVTKQEAPTYRLVIKNPMDFGTIKDKIGKMAYKNRAEFLQDVALVRDNCLVFNGEIHPFTINITEIYNLFYQQVEKYDAELTEAENEAAEDGLGSRITALPLPSPAPSQAMTADTPMTVATPALGFGTPMAAYNLASPYATGLSLDGPVADSAAAGADEGLGVAHDPQDTPMGGSESDTRTSFLLPFDEVTAEAVDDGDVNIED